MGDRYKGRPQGHTALEPKLAQLQQQQQQQQQPGSPATGKVRSLFRRKVAKAENSQTECELGI